jgi:hypothetical protein
MSGSQRGKTVKVSGYHRRRPSRPKKIHRGAAFYRKMRRR